MERNSRGRKYFSKTPKSTGESLNPEPFAPHNVV